MKVQIRHNNKSGLVQVFGDDTLVSEGNGPKWNALARNVVAVATSEIKEVSQGHVKELTFQA